jgi:anaphase-promoting complex subunit 4
MVHNINSSAVQLGDGQIKDVKFSDSVLLVLWESKGKSQLAHISGG